MIVAENMGNIAVNVFVGKEFVRPLLRGSAFGSLVIDPAQLKTAVIVHGVELTQVEVRYHIHIHPLGLGVAVAQTGVKELGLAFGNSGAEIGFFHQQTFCQSPVGCRKLACLGGAGIVIGVTPAGRTGDLVDVCTVGSKLFLVNIVEFFLQYHLTGDFGLLCIAGAVDPVAIGIKIKHIQIPRIPSQRAQHHGVGVDADTVIEFFHLVEKLCHFSIAADLRLHKIFDKAGGRTAAAGVVHSADIAVHADKEIFHAVIFGFLPLGKFFVKVTHVGQAAIPHTGSPDSFHSIFKIFAFGVGYVGQHRSHIFVDRNHDPVAGGIALAVSLGPVETAAIDDGSTAYNFVRIALIVGVGYPAVVGSN